MADDYELLGFGGLTSLVTEIAVEQWGSQIRVQCLYDPTGDRVPYQLIFEGCERSRWEVYHLEAVNDTEADLIGIHLGTANYQKPALIHTDIFELEILYQHFRLEKPNSSVSNRVQTHQNAEFSQSVKS